MIVIKPSAAPDNGDFSRASAGTYIGLDGRIKTAATDAPRYQGGRLLMEAAATNLLQYSEDMRNTAEAGASRPWAQFDDTGDAVAVLSVSTTKPDGATGSVSKLTANTTASVQRQTSQQISGLADNAVVTFSVCLKAGEVPRASLLISTKSPAYPTALFDLTTGVVSSTSGGGGAPPVAGIVALAGGWYRCWVAVSVGAGASTPGVIVQLKNAAGGNYAGAVGDGLYLWGAQAEIGGAPTSYIPRTGTAAASRAADVYTAGYIACGDLDGAAVGLSPYRVDETSDADLWAAGTAYAVNDLAVRTQTHRVYRRLVPGTTSTPPEGDATNWADIGATQKYRPFDGVASNSSMLRTFYSLAFSFFMAGANTISLVGLRGISATVVITDGPGGAVLSSASKTFSGDRYAYPEWAGAATQFSLVDWHLTGLPAGYPNAVAHVVVVAGPLLTNYAGVREVYYGGGFDIGETQGSPRVGITDYSRKETDAFGNASFVRRAFSRRLSCEVRVPLASFQQVYSLLADLRATICQWIPESSGSYQPLMMAGWYRDFSIAIAYPTYLLCTLEVESLAVDTLAED